MTFDKKKWAKDNKEKMQSYRDKYKKNNLEKHKAQQKKYDTTKKDRVKERVRQKTNYHNEKTNVCHDCHESAKTEFHHISYSPNIFIELCKNCHRRRHFEEDDLTMKGGKKMKATITEIVGKNIKFIEEGHPEIQEAELAEFVMDFAKLGAAEMTVKDGVVSFCTMKVDAPKDSKPTPGAKPGTKKKWEDDMVTFETLLTKAHKKAKDDKVNMSIKTTIIKGKDGALVFDLEKKFAMFKARVLITDLEGKELCRFEGHGDATADNVKGDHIKPHFIRMAETRAIVRALRWYTNNGCAEEEK